MISRYRGLRIPADACGMLSDYRGARAFSQIGTRTYRAEVNRASSYNIVSVSDRTFKLKPSSERTSGRCRRCCDK